MCIVYQSNQPDKKKNKITSFCNIIKSMKKLLIFIMLLLSCTVGYCEDIPANGCGYSLTKETNPIYWGYLEDYGEKLKQALESKKMFRLRGMGASYRFFITRDGEIKDMKISTYQNKYFNEKVKEVILSVKPLPFREGMNVDEMQFSVYLGYEKYDEIDVGIGSSFINNKDIFQVSVTTKK